MQAVRFRIVYGLLAGLAACAPAQPEALQAWVRAAPDGTALTAAFVELRNSGGHDWLISVQSDAHQSASFHETLLENGVYRMRKLERIELKPGQTVNLQPGGMHIMLSSPTRNLSAGDQIALSLALASGKTIHVQAVISRVKP